MERKAILANGWAAFGVETDAAMMRAVWFGYGYYQAMQGDASETAAYLSDLRALYKDAGFTKGGAQQRAVVAAKEIGSAMLERFGAQLVTVWLGGVPDMISAMVGAAKASNATTVPRLVDWCKHGDALHAIKAEQLKADQKAYESEMKKENQDSAIASIIEQSQGIDAIAALFRKPEPMPQGSKVEPPEPLEATAERIAKMEATVLAMGDALLRNLEFIVKAEIARRINAVPQKAIAA